MIFWNNYKIYKFIIIFLWLLISTNGSASIKNSTLDLTNWTPDSGPVYLKGTIKFIPNKLIKPNGSIDKWNELFAKSKSIRTDLFWHQNADINIKKAKFGTYLLKIIWPSNNQYPLAMRESMGINSAFEIEDWELRTIVARSGKPGVSIGDEIPWWINHVFPLPNIQHSKKNSFFLIRISSFNYKDQGITTPPEINRYEYLNQKITYKKFVLHLNTGILVVLGIYHLILFLFKTSDKTNLYFCIICFTIITREYATDRVFEDFIGIGGSKLFTLINFRLEFASTVLALIALLFYLENLLPNLFAKNPIIKKLWLATSFALLACCIFISNHPALSKILFLFHFYYIISAVYISTHLIRRSFSYNEGRNFARIYLLFILILSAAIIHDIGSNLLILKTPLILHYIIPVLFIAQSITLGAKYKNTFILEARFNEARQVQQAILPPKQETADLSVNYIYLSADHTGGDWFDYHYDKYSKNIFVMIGDVTGHGVASSLLTSTATGAARSSFHVIKKQGLSLEKAMSLVIETINETVLITGEKVNKLMTMTIAAWNMDSGSGYYANLGHHPILKVSNNSEVKTVFKSGPIIGLHPKLKYHLQPLYVDKGDFIIMYTDGFVENRGPNGEGIHMRKVIKSLKNTNNPNEAIKVIQSYIKEKWKNHKVEDDCTVLAVGRKKRRGDYQV